VRQTHPPNRPPWANPAFAEPDARHGAFRGDARRTLKRNPLAVSFCNAPDRQLDRENTEETRRLERSGD